MKTHSNIPIFIPHLGCPNDCIFCNQKKISGVTFFDKTLVEAEIEKALATVKTDECEIAFFGGSFTGIDRDLMIYLLEIANKFIKCGKVDSIRCSTRPDYISSEVLEILKKYGVKTIELGIQSTSENVLAICRRGHTVEDTARACRLIVDAGFDLVGQMMIGLPSSTSRDELDTADFIIKSGARSARIYPTVVFRETELCSMAINGMYDPLTLCEAVSRTSKVYKKFLDAGVEVIRVGLCSSDNLSSPESVYAGANHAAFGELVENEIYYEMLCEAFSKYDKTLDQSFVVEVSSRCLSKAIGQRKSNKMRLIDKFKLKKLTFTSNDDIEEFEFRILLERKQTGCT